MLAVFLFLCALRGSVGVNTAVKDALKEFGEALDYKSWDKNTHWLSDKKDVCDWYGITCDGDRVTEIKLKDNHLKGTLPDSIGAITDLESLVLNSQRPDGYVGCGSNNLQNGSIPSSLASLTSLTELNLEYTCTSGTLDVLPNMPQLQEISLHGNYIHGTIPESLNLLSELTILKLGRNPITGTLPHFTSFSKMIQFNCNFCSLTGPFPDFFDSTPTLQVSYWDGNGFSGNLPKNIGAAKNLTRLSFNINNFSGDVPPGICTIPAGSGSQTAGTDHDCRIGADTNLTEYQANYPWIQQVSGNLYNCGTMPTCVARGSCNHTGGTKVVNPSSPLECK